MNYEGNEEDWLPSPQTTCDLTGTDPNGTWLIYRLLRMGTFVDVEGRPISEGKMLNALHSTKIPIKYETCPFPGARQRAQPLKKMNSAAMERVLKTLPQSFGLFIACRNCYIEVCNSKILLPLDVWRVGVSIAGLPKFLAWRAVDPIANGALLPFIADARKAALGMNAVLFDLVLREFLAIASRSELTLEIEALSSAADKFLVGENEVCPASPNLISEAFSVVTSGEANFRVEHQNLEQITGCEQAYCAFSFTYSDFNLARLFLCMYGESLTEPARAEKLSPNKNQQQSKSGRYLTQNVLARALSDFNESDRQDLLLEILSRLSFDSSEVISLCKLYFSEQKYSSRYVDFEQLTVQVFRYFENRFRNSLGHQDCLSNPPLSIVNRILKASWDK